LSRGPPLLSETGTTPAKVIQQGVVTHTLPVEAFATRIKMESSDQRSFRSPSRDQDEF